jgi:DNA-directed RNA polymerase omega subunit
MIIKIPKEFDSKFRFIAVAAERAKQIQNGSPSRLDLESRKPAYLAIREVEESLVPFSILEETDKKEE